MDIGLFVFAIDSSLDVAEHARRAEELGFESFWVPEHVTIPVHTSSPYSGSVDGKIPESYWQIVDPFIALARASGVTSNIKLGTAVCLVPEHHPIHLAKQVATLDHYSGGRFILGIGTGWLREECEVMGGNFDHRWGQARESILAAKELWTKPEAEYHGRYVDFPLQRSFPKPAQKPHPPIYMGGKAQNVFKRIVEWGDGWMPTRATPDEIRIGRASMDELASHAGRDPSSLNLSVFGTAGQFASRESIKPFEDAGADRIILWLQQTAGPGSITEMEELARWALP